MGDMHDKTGFICPKCDGSKGYWAFRAVGEAGSQAEYLICHEDGEPMSLPGKNPSVRNNEGALDKGDRVLPLVLGWGVVLFLNAFIIYVLVTWLS